MDNQSRNGVPRYRQKAELGAGASLTIGLAVVFSMLALGISFYTALAVSQANKDARATAEAQLKAVQIIDGWKNGNDSTAEEPRDPERDQP